MKHGSILNGNIGLRRVSSQWKSTSMGRMIQFNTSSPYDNARRRPRRWNKAQAILRNSQAS
ncbi:ClbS/DfsB family four-helix bundle protein [Aminobacter aminovorans]|uniref:ClbS/DfsB family four-helix bundle protein n=1 Tax=Aminobacter aminovorans TaxID=83263 RepID=UPI000AEB0F70